MRSIFFITAITLFFTANLFAQGPSKAKPENIQFQIKETGTVSANQKTILSQKLITDWSLTDLLKGAKVVTGSQPTIFSPEDKGTSTKDADGVITLTTFSDVTLPANTKGEIIDVKKDGNGKITEISVCFWKDVRLFLVYVPSVGGDQAFILKVGGNAELSIGSYNYKLTSGGGTDNPLSLMTKTETNVAPVVPGRG